MPFKDAVPSVVIAVHTCGDFLHVNPHLHITTTDSSFRATVNLR
jgi:hypothetical protein